MTLVDTAGWRDTRDIIEAEGVARGTRARGVADLVLLVIDRSTPLTDDDRRLLEDTSGTNHILVLNKSDLPCEAEPTWASPDGLAVSALSGEGCDALRRTIATRLAGEERLRD